MEKAADIMREATLAKDATQVKRTRRRHGKETAEHAWRRKTRSVCGTMKMVDQVIACLPCVILSIVWEYARTILKVDHSQPQTRKVDICCVSEDQKRLFVVMQQDGGSLNYCAVQCVETETLKILSQGCLRGNIITGTVFHNKLHLVCDNPDGRGIVTYDFWYYNELAHYRIDDHHEMPSLRRIFPYKGNVLIGICGLDKLQHLDLDDASHQVLEIKTSTWSDYFILDATVNEQAAEIFVATNDYKRSMFTDVIRVVDAKSLMQKSVISCGGGFGSIHALSYSHLTHSLFVAYAGVTKDVDSDRHLDQTRIIMIRHPSRDDPGS